ncbi:BMP family ABC transporter substrate-binding protein [Succinispira mobilis]|uniref:BMP family ABC transporter substrate-binding protein n=1 Tax=Succinispira mobilis TaxID=78120 RepID=UPI00035D8076|nr:BMP family ABC transporter substrate-binding protein [Succinispira mobilis]
MKKLFKGFLVATLLGSMLLAGCGGEKKADTKQEKTKVAFVYIGSAKDGGWSESHDNGRKYLLEKVPNVETTVVESVPAGADSERVINQLAGQGNKIIFTTSFGFMDPTLNVAKKYPDIVFMHASGYKTDKNMGNYFGRIYEARYLTGMVAGKETKSNVIGYVAAFPIPEVVRGINAFTLGVKAVNPNATVKVIWTNTWYDPAKEKQAGLSLIDSGADIITQHQDTMGAQQAAQERGKYSIGYNLDMGKVLPKTVLTSAIWNWGPFYKQLVENVQKGTWKTGAYWGSMKDGVVDIAPYGSMVQEDTKKVVDSAKAQLKDGKLIVFKGPIKDQKGNVKVAAGETMADKDLLSFDWFVEGVEGTVKN